MSDQKRRNGSKPNRTTGHGKPKLGEADRRVLDEWAAWQKAAHRSRETVNRKDKLLTKFAESISSSLVDATDGDVIDWFQNNDRWAPGTAHLYFNILNSWFVWLQRTKRRADNPMTMLDSPRRPEYLPRPVPDEDLRRMLATNMRSRTRAMIMLAFLAGLRVSEIARVKGEDVDLSGRLLYVRGKGGSVKPVPLNERLVNLACQMPATGWWFPGRESFGGYIDPTRHVDAKSVSNTIQAVMKRAGVRATPHALRHWFGTNALQASGGDLRAVQVLMRHTSVQSTQIYTAVADDRRAEIVEMLDPWASRSRPAPQRKPEGPLR